MANYKIISQVSAHLIKQLKSTLVPNIIRNDGDIGLSSEYSQLNHVLSVVLYDIVKLDPTLYKLNNPNDLVLGLDYMFAAESKEDANFRPIIEQEILGAVLSLFNNADLFVLPAQSLPIRITLTNISFEDKTKMQLKSPALYYQAAPIIISAATENLPRIL